MTMPGDSSSTFRDDRLEHLAHVVRKRFVREVRERTTLSTFAMSKNENLLLVAQHLECGLAEHREVQTRAVRATRSRT